MVTWKQLGIIFGTLIALAVGGYWVLYQFACMMSTQGVCP
jgi:hypothetical protein